MPDNWFYVSQKTKLGPCTFEQLQELAAFGTLQATDMVLAPPGQKWAPANTIPGLIAPAAPPTLQARAVAALRMVPLWVWYAAGPTCVVLFCCGGAGLYGVVAMFRPSAQPVQSTNSSVAAAATSKESKDSKDSKKVPQPSSEGIDAKAFYSEFRRDFFTAQQKYQDKVVAIRGALVSVEGTELRAGVVTVTLDSGRASGEFSGTHKERASKLKRGDSIAFRGRLVVVNDLFAGASLVFKECEFVD